MSQELGNPHILIEIDQETGTYSIEFGRCKAKTAYAVLRSIVDQMEEGSFWDNDLIIEDENGQQLDASDARESITAARKQINGEDVTDIKAGNFKD